MRKATPLTKTHPELCEEWDWEKNEISPDDISHGVTKKVWWRCKNGHSFLRSPNQRTNVRKKGNYESTYVECPIALTLLRHQASIHLQQNTLSYLKNGTGTRIKQMVSILTIFFLNIKNRQNRLKTIILQWKILRNRSELSDYQEYIKGDFP